MYRFLSHARFAIAIVAAIGAIHSRREGRSVTRDGPEGVSAALLRPADATANRLAKVWKSVEMVDDHGHHPE
jgi:hypothetical protein